MGSICCYDASAASRAGVQVLRIYSSTKKAFTQIHLAKGDQGYGAAFLACVTWAAMAEAGCRA